MFDKNDRPIGVGNRVKLPAGFSLEGFPPVPAEVGVRYVHRDGSNTITAECRIKQPYGFETISFPVPAADVEVVGPAPVE